MKVLIVEDERTLSDTIKQCICKKFDTEQAYDGYEAYMMAKENIYDAIILDLMLPEMSGYDVLLKLRENKVLKPVLILTAKESLNDKVSAFEIGANDYLTKPFYMEELVARIYAILRTNGKMQAKNTIDFKDLHLDLNKRRVFIKDEEIELQNKQFNLLEYLLLNKGSILLKEQIYDRVWGIDSDVTIEIVEVYISHLRKKLSKYGYDKCIKTKRKVGYMFDDK